MLLLGARNEIVPRLPICQMLADLPRRPEIVRRLYPDGHHMLLRDLASARVIADIAAWIGGAALPPLPAPTATGFLTTLRGDNETAGDRQRAIAAAPGDQDLA